MKRILWLFTAAIVMGSCSMNRRVNSVAKKTILSNQNFANAHTGIAVYDPQSGKYLYDYQSEKYFVPASNTKLTSCYLAMKYLGDSLPGVQYQLLDDSSVLIAGTADPTILHPDFSSHRVYDFLKRFKEIHFYTSGFDQYLGNGWSWNDYTEDYMAPRSSMPLYGNVARFQFQKERLSVQPDYFEKEIKNAGSARAGIRVDRPWSQNLFLISDGKSSRIGIPFVPDDQTIAGLLSDTLNARVVSDTHFPTGTNFVYTRSLDSMLAITMHRSDNFFAEQSLLMVSQKLTGKMDDRLIIQKILSSDFKDLPQKPGWVDGSGLSRYNLFSPRDFVFILQKLKDEFGLDRMKVILPTGGTGTLSSLYKNETGHIFAKTGTLNGVVALSGYLITAKNKLLIFSVLVNNHRGSASDIRKGIEQFLTKIIRQN